MISNTLLICKANHRLPSIVVIGFLFLVSAFNGAIADTYKKPIRVLIVGGGSSHDFDRWYKEVDTQTLEKGKFSEVRYTDNTDSIAHYLKDTDVLYLTNNQPIPNKEVRKAIFEFARQGKGIVLGHAALWYNWQDWPEYNQKLVSGGSRGHDPYGKFQVNIVDSKHPLTRKIKSFSLEDELYYFKSDASGPGIKVLAEAVNPEKGERFPSVFIINHPEARIAAIALGHDGAAHELKAYQRLLRNAVSWAAASQ